MERRPLPAAPIHGHRDVDHAPAPLEQVDELHASADLHSGNMAVRDFFAHRDLDTGESPWDRIADQGYIYITAGENIAAPLIVLKNGFSVGSGGRLSAGGLD